MAAANTFYVFNITHVPASESSLEIVVTVLLFPGPIVPGLVRYPSKARDFGKVVRGRGWRAHASQRAELPVSLGRIECALRAVVGSGKGPHKLYIERIEAAVICQQFCDGRDGRLLCWAALGCAEGTQKPQRQIRDRS